MLNTKYKDQIIQYVLDSSNEENERLASVIARMRDEKRAGLQAGRGKSIPVSGDGPRHEEQSGAVSECGPGAVFQELS
jgi:hypothetical protein